MTTRQRNRRVQVRPSDTFVGTGVHAPSFVRANDKTARQADALSEALGFTQRAVSDAVVRRQDKAFLKGTEAFFEGRDITAEEQKSDAFKFGYMSSEHDRKLINFKTELAESYPQDRVTPGFDINAWFDQKAADAFPLDPEIDIDKALIPRTADFLKRLRESYLQAEVGNARSEVLDRTAGNIVLTADDRVSTDGPLTEADWKQFNADAMAMGAGGDYAHRIALAIAEQRAIAGDVESLEALPKTYNGRVGTFRNNPKFAGQYESLLARAQKVRADALEEASVAYVGVARSRLTQLAEAGDISAPDAIVAATKPDNNGVTVLETPEQVASLMNRWYDARETEALDATALTAWRAGNGRILTGAEKDAAAAQDVQAIIKNAIAGGREPAEAQALGRAYAVERATVNNHLPSFLKAELDVSPKNPKAWQNAVALYDNLEAQQQGFAGRHLRSDLVRDIVTYKRMLREHGGNAEQALDALNSIDRDLIKQVPAKDRREAEEAVRDELADGPLFSTLVEDSLPLRKLVTEELDYYLSRGYSLEQAVQNTTDSLHPKNGRYTVVAGHLYKHGSGWDHNAAQVAEWVRQQYAEENDVPARKVQILPIPSKPGRVRIVSDENLLPGSVTEIAIADLNAEWSRRRAEADLQAAKQGKEQARAEAIRKAKESLFPIPSIISKSDPNYRLMLDAREQRWNTLTDPERQRLIERSIK